MIRAGRSLLLAVALAALRVPRLAAQDQAPDSSFLRALQLESDGKYRDAAPLYRKAIFTADGQNALLGLERVYAELGWTDSLIAPLDSLLAAHPADAVYRGAQLRSLQTLGREADLRSAFESWTRAAAKDATPYREYARVLIQRSHAPQADSVLAQGREAIGSMRGMEAEEAQVRAASGDWVQSAEAWRASLQFSPELDQAAAYSLNPAPAASRDSIRAIFAASPVLAPFRLALARLETNWGSPAAGWRALAVLPPDSVAVDAWLDFADGAEADGQWQIARDALVAAMKARPSAALAVRAATAAMNTGDANGALALLPLTTDGDSAKVARTTLPVRVKALATLGRVDEAQALAASYDRWLVAAQRTAMTRTVAWGWVRRGDMEHARESLAAIGAEADSGDTAGWLALYDGDIRTARRLLRSGGESTPELALALATVARIKSDRSAEVGAAFLSLARGDTVGAAAAFITAANATPDAASTLLAVSAQLDVARGADSVAVATWTRILDKYPESAEAPEAELAWARALLKRNDVAGAVTRLEHLILTYPQSALLPQARRELDRARGRGGIL